MFQFLIGSLITRLESEVTTIIGKFQFLIGSLITYTLILRSFGSGSFNSL